MHIIEDFQLTAHRYGTNCLAADNADKYILKNSIEAHRCIARYQCPLYKK